MPPDLRIRRAVREDAGEILTLQRAAWVTQAQLHDTAFLPPLTESLDAIASFVERATALVGHHGSRLVGTARGESDPYGTWLIGRLGVVPDLQGHGIGSALLAAIEASAPPNTVRFELFTGPKSVDNIAFYERHGYTRIPSRDGLVHLTKPATDHPEPR